MTYFDPLEESLKSLSDVLMKLAKTIMKKLPDQQRAGK